MIAGVPDRLWSTRDLGTPGDPVVQPASSVSG